MEPKEQNGVMTLDMVHRFQENLDKNTGYKIAMNAVTRQNIQEVALNRDILNNLNFSFSHEIETAEITDQKRASTCWLFAELNWLRTNTQKKFNIKEIVFSHNYIMFWDKFEKANYFFENIIKYRDRDLDDRHVYFLLKTPIPDGGEWHMMMNVIRKYGIVPKSAMIDSFTVENSRFLNEVLGFKLREGAAKIRNMHENGKPVEALREIKNKLMEEVYRILVIFFGVPPKKFDWSYRDKDKKFFRELQITPNQFFEKYIGLNMDEVYCLLSCPTPKTPYYKTYTVEFFNNMIGGRDWLWLNVPIEELKKCAVNMLKNSDAVLYGCDVVQESHSKEGILHKKLFDYDLIFNTSFEMDKTTRIQYLQTILTHSMVFIGVDLVDDKPVKWKIENSWGTEVGKKGFFIMTDEWFDEHTFDMMVPGEYLSSELKELFKIEPIVLPPWHPMA
jgi:bleomycin hydrolase